MEQQHPFCQATVTRFDGTSHCFDSMLARISGWLHLSFNFWIFFFVFVFLNFGWCPFSLQFDAGMTSVNFMKYLGISFQDAGVIYLIFQIRSTGIFNRLCIRKFVFPLKIRRTELSMGCCILFCFSGHDDWQNSQHYLGSPAPSGYGTVSSTLHTLNSKFRLRLYQAIWRDVTVSLFF